MKLRKKYCEYHKKECYIWKNFNGMRFCKEGWSKYKGRETRSKETGVKDLVRLLDSLVREILFLEKPHRCFTCGYIPKEKRELQVGHFVSRRHLSLRWDFENVELQCTKCNCELLGNLGIYGTLIGEERVSSLRSKMTEVTKLSKLDLEELVNQLKQRRDVPLC